MLFKIKQDRQYTCNVTLRQFHITIFAVEKQQLLNTGRFLMYSGFTKTYYRKTVGHVFTKLVEIEGTTQNIFFPVSCFSS